MATFTANAAAATVGAKHPVNAGQPITVYGEYTMLAAPANGDVFQMVRVPSGARIVNMSLTSTDIDTDGAPTATLSVGDGSSTARFISASTIGQAGGIANGISVFGGFGYAYTAEDTIDVIIPTGPATGAIGTLKLAVTYVM